MMKWGKRVKKATSNQDHLTVDMGKEEEWESGIRIREVHTTGENNLKW